MLSIDGVSELNLDDVIGKLPYDLVELIPKILQKVLVWGWHSYHWIVLVLAIPKLVSDLS